MHSICPFHVGSVFHNALCCRNKNRPGWFFIQSGLYLYYWSLQVQSKTPILGWLLIHKTFPCVVLTWLRIPWACYGVQKWTGTVYCTVHSPVVYRETKRTSKEPEQNIFDQKWLDISLLPSKTLISCSFLLKSFSSPLSIQWMQCTALFND